MGPYCQFCGRRCFLVRRLPHQAGDTLMATCQDGMDHDRTVTGYDHLTAINPAGLSPFCGPATLSPFCGPHCAAGTIQGHCSRCHASPDGRRPHPAAWTVTT